MNNTDSKYLSDCHNVAVYVVGGDEGTNHYECSECKEACNFHPKDTDSPLDEIYNRIKTLKDKL